MASRAAPIHGEDDWWKLAVRVRGLERVLSFGALLNNWMHLELSVTFLWRFRIVTAISMWEFYPSVTFWYCVKKNLQLIVDCSY